MENLWNLLDNFLSFVTGLSLKYPHRDCPEYAAKLLTKATAEFSKIFKEYSETLKELKLENATALLKKILKDDPFLQKLLLVFSIFAFSCYISFVKTKSVKSSAIRTISTFLVYLVIAGSYKEIVLDTFEPVYSSSYTEKIPVIVSFARYINFPIILLAFAISILLGLIYKVFRILLFVLITLRLKNLFFLDDPSIQNYALFFILNFFLFLVFSKILKVLEITAISIFFSGIGTFSMLVHLMVFERLQGNIEAFVSAFINGAQTGILKNPMFLTWIVLFAYSVKVTYFTATVSK